jgi:hypothetical protein
VKAQADCDRGQPLATERASAGDAIPPKCHLIEVRITELRQLFNAIDPSPFHERDLDPQAEDFIVGWARQLPRDEPLGLSVYLVRAPGRPDEAAILRDAIHEFFARRAVETRRKLRELFHNGRISLAIGLAFVASSILIGDAVVTYFKGSRWPDIVRESLLIGGWVAMWRPLEVFLYGWWPIRADARLFDRLSAMPVRIVYQSAASSGAWRTDWPVVRGERHQHTREEERMIREAALDDTLERTFPASDPLSSDPNPDDHDALMRQLRPGEER